MHNDTVANARAHATAPGVWPHAPIDGAGARGHFLLLRELHSSAHSQVFLAHDRVLDRTVALKTLPPGRRGSLRHAANLRAEARLLANFTHPHVVSLYSVEEDDDGPYLTLEYLNGRTLAQRLRDGVLAPAQAVAIFTQLLDAVDSIHRHGVIHGDLAPSNIFLLNDDTVKLLDFGAARVEAYADMGTEEPDVDSLMYFAPERLHSGVRDVATDLYTVGMVLYQSLCGYPAASDDGERTLEHRLGALPAALRAAVLRATANDPALRFKSAIEFRHALRAANAEANDAANASASRQIFTQAMRSTSAALASARRWTHSVYFDLALVGVLVALLFALGLTPSQPRAPSDTANAHGDAATSAGRPAAAAKKTAAVRGSAPAPARRDGASDAGERPGDRYRSLRKAWGTE